MRMGVALALGAWPCWSLGRQAPRQVPANQRKMVVGVETAGCGESMCGGTSCTTREGMASRPFTRTEGKGTKEEQAENTHKHSDCGREVQQREGSG